MSLHTPIEIKTYCPVGHQNIHPSFFQGIRHRLCYRANLFSIQVPSFHPSKPHTPVRRPNLMYFCFASRHQCEEYYLIQILFSLPRYNSGPCSLRSTTLPLPCHSACCFEYGRTILVSPSIASLPGFLFLLPFLLPCFLVCCSPPLSLIAKL